MKEVLARKKKDQPLEDQSRILEKLEKKERLTNDEFWSVYASIRKPGPLVKYQNPENWDNYEKFTGNS